MNKGNKNLAQLGVCLVFAFSFVEAISRDSTMVLENNQFKNMVIAIHESVTEDKSLITTLKDTMAKASQYLFTATRQRAYFREITILLPATWSDDSSYGIPTNESLQFADVVITNPTKSKRSLPHARSYSGCGKQGVHVLLTKQFLTDESVDPYTNDSAKYFVHAFAQFRWGVFQEYAEPGEVQFYFSIKEGRADAIKCALGMLGLIVRTDTVNFTICYHDIDPNTNLYIPACEWKPYPVRQRVTASIMDHQYIQRITTFCDDTTNPRTAHNYESPSKHNRLCGHRSTWDIITNTPDFSNNKNPPVTGGIGQSQLTPTFKVIRARSRKRRAIVAVETPEFADDFGETTETHVKRFLHEHNDKDNVVLVQYNGTDELMHSLKEIEVQLHESIIVLITSSQQQSQSQTQVANELKNRGSDIHIVGVGDEGVLNWPTDVSGYHGSHHPGSTVYDHLSSVLNEMVEEQDHFIMVLRDEIQLADRKAKQQRTFYIDPSLTTNVVATFHITRGNTHSVTEETFPDVALESPTGEVIWMDSEKCDVDKTLGVLHYRFQKAVEGLWKYKISPKAENYNISITVKAKRSPLLDEDPIIVRHKVETNLDDHNVALFCDVTRGNQPVIGLHVTATIAKHGGHTRTIQLWDNGAGADISKDDGIYSRYVIKLEKGIHHVTFKVIGENGKVWSKEESLDINDLHGPDSRISRRITKRQVDGAFQRHVYGGSVRLHVDLHNAEDNIAPSRITDLKVLKILIYRKSMVLTWTAPGDDLDTGKVARYELLIGRNIKDVRELLTFASTGANHSGIEIETVPAIKEAGEVETLLWNIGDISRAKSFAFAIRAVDGVRNWAPVSNVATVGFDRKQG